MDLSKLTINPKSGDEPFHTQGQTLQATVLDFWRWAFSDLVDNTTRGAVAEFIVALALGVTEIRVGWSAYDLTTRDGIKVEVKSAAYLQSWGQARYSDIQFSIAPTQAFDDVNNVFISERKRQADVYVFALIHHKDKQSLDPLNVDQWRFYIVPTVALNHYVPTQKVITLSRLLMLNPIEAQFSEIEDAIRRAIAI